MLIPALVLIVLALRGGGYDTVTTNALGLLAWIGVLVGVAFSRPPSREVWIAGTSIFAFTVWTGLSTLWSESAERSFAEFGQTATYFALFTATVIACQRLGGTARIVDGLTIGMAVIVGLALLSRLEPSLFPERTLQTSVPETRARLTYPFNYWNAVALGVAMAIPLFLHLAARENLSRGLRAIGPALLPMSGLALYFTFSRGGLVSTVAAAGLFLAFTAKRTQTLVTIALGGAGAAVLIVAARSADELNDGFLETSAAKSAGHLILVLTLVVTAVVWALARAVGTVSVNFEVSRRSARTALAVAGAVGLLLAVAIVASADLGSRLESLRGSEHSAPEGRFLSGNSNGRSAYWKSAKRAFQDHPIAGIGSGSWTLYWQRAPTIPNFVRDPHSLWADIAAELGALGLIAALVMFAALFWFGFKAVRARDPDPAAGALLALMVAFLLGVSVDWTWEITSIGAPFFVAAALLVARLEPTGAAAADETEPRRESRRRYQRLVSRGIVVAFIAWAAIFAEAVPLLSTWQVDRSQAAVRDGDLNAAREAAQTARSVQPWAAGPNMQLAQVLELQNNLDEARRYAVKAVDQEPTNWATWLVLSRIEKKAGNDELALEYMATAYNHNPGSPYWISIGFQKR